MNATRFLWRRAAITAGLMAAVGLAQAQSSSAPLRLVVPFGPGTTTDIVARLVGEAMAGVLGQTPVVENKAGAGGTIGSETVAKAARNGTSGDLAGELLAARLGGKLRALGASGARRSAATPEVTRLRDAMQRALATPAVAARLTELGVESRALPVTELAAFGQAEIKRWSEAVKRSGAQVD